MEATASLLRKSRRLRRKPTAAAADALVSLAASPSRPASAASGALPVSESVKGENVRQLGGNYRSLGTSAVGLRPYHSRS